MKRWSIHAVAASMLLATLLSGCGHHDPVKNAQAAAAQAAEDAPEEEELQEPGAPACTENCPGHDAGYEWAVQKGITDPNDCGGNSDSFVEGCMAYAEEQRQDRD